MYKKGSNILIWMHSHWRIGNMLQKKKHNSFFSLTASGVKNSFKKLFDCIVFYLCKEELNLCKYNHINCKSTQSFFIPLYISTENMFDS
jgi:hypothetical protein